MVKPVRKLIKVTIGRAAAPHWRHSVIKSRIRIWVFSKGSIKSEMTQAPKKLNGLDNQLQNGSHQSKKDPDTGETEESLVLST